MLSMETTKNSWIFFIVFSLLFVFSLVSVFYRYVVIEDFEVYVEFDENGELLYIE